jgi:hypothetical protein
MTTKLFKSFGLILATFAGTWMLGPILFPLGLWIILFSLFLVSRYRKSFTLFQEWSWLHFLVTLVVALVLPFVVTVLFFPGF